MRPHRYQISTRLKWALLKKHGCQTSTTPNQGNSVRENGIQIWLVSTTIYVSGTDYYSKEGSTYTYATPHSVHLRIPPTALNERCRRWSMARQAIRVHRLVHENVYTRIDTYE